MKHQYIPLILALALVGPEAGAQNFARTLNRFPFFVSQPLPLDGSGRRSLTSALVIVNPNDEAVDVKIQVKNTQGQEVAVALNAFDLDCFSTLANPFRVPPRSSAAVCVNSAVALSGGSLTAESSAPVGALEWIRIVSILPFPDTVVSGIVTPITGAQLQPAEPMTSFFLRVEQTGITATGLSLLNESDTAAEGTLFLRDENGAEVARRSLVLEPRGQIVQLAGELFPELAALPRGGTLEGSFPRPVLAASLSVSLDERALTHVRPPGITLPLLAANPVTARNPPASQSRKARK